MLPALFVAHGSPWVLNNKKKTGEYFAWAQQLPLPRAILIMSSHWLDENITIGNIGPSKLIYDYSGFEKEYYDLKYNAPVASFLASSVESKIVENFGSVKVGTRGWDHGVFLPLMCMYPDANVPILQISLPVNLTPALIYKLGEELSFLREDILIIGSGTVVHNLGLIESDEDAEPHPWAVDFDNWIKTSILNQDVKSLIEFESAAPDFHKAHPTPEHYLPLLFALGAGAKSLDAVSFPIEGFEYANISRRSVQFGA